MKKIFFSFLVGALALHLQAKKQIGAAPDPVFHKLSITEASSIEWPESLNDAVQMEDASFYHGNELIQQQLKDGSVFVSAGNNQDDGHQQELSCTIPKEVFSDKESSSKNRISYDEFVKYLRATTEGKKINLEPSGYQVSSGIIPKYYVRVFCYYTLNDDDMPEVDVVRIEVNEVVSATYHTDSKGDIDLAVEQDWIKKKYWKRSIQK